MENARFNAIRDDLDKGESAVGNAGPRSAIWRATPVGAPQVTAADEVTGGRGRAHHVNVSARDETEGSHGPHERWWSTCRRLDAPGCGERR